MGDDLRDGLLRLVKEVVKKSHECRSNAGRARLSGMSTKILAGQFRGRLLYTPKGETTRPTLAHLRKSLFDICQTYIEGANFLDLFAGSGAVAFEAMSRGARRAVLVENDRWACQAIEKNQALLLLENKTTLRRQDVFDALSSLLRLRGQFDIIFADPPYLKAGEDGRLYAQKVTKILGSTPLLAPGGMFFLEEPEKSPPASDKTLGDLILVSERKLGRSTLRQYQKPLADIT